VKYANIEFYGEITMKKQKKAYPYDFKTMFGISIQGLISVGGAALMSTMFMVYLTDYAGIGPWGAVLGTTVLFVGRIFDAINDPIEGWIMDSAKVTKLGKYKKFIIASIIISMISLTLLYNMPDSIVSMPVVAGTWVIFFYFLYDIGTSFNAFIPFTRSLTSDDVLRAKFFTMSRIVGTIGGIPMGLLMSAALAIGARTGSIKHAMGGLIAVAITVIGGISLLGIFLVKEGKYAPKDEKGERVKFSDIFTMIKTNRAMSTQVFSTLFSGFMWTIVVAVEVYYVKWAYFADLTTGVVDNDKLAMYSIILGMASMVPIFLATGFSPLIIKKIGSNVKAQMLSLFLTIIPSALLYIFQLVGILQSSFPLLFILIFLVCCGSGIGYVPTTNIWAECIDYNRYMTGKEMGGLVGAIRSLLEKGQGAIAGGVTGVLLIAIGYNVDSDTGNYLGDLSKMPSLLNNFALLMGVIPALLAVIAIFIYKKWYPITPELKQKMKEQFEREDTAAGSEA
jgi:Na+/melibiose symporter-like transporter